MYRFALIMMLYNTLKETWHPIFYFESPLPGPIEEATLIRFKSKGHHTTGFKTRDEALFSATELHKQLLEQKNTVFVETEGDLPWDGVDIPADTQFRKADYLKKAV